ncbi:urokinase plasminogen activator surface receptor-like isoform X6 [Halichoeres trimaculatus]
MKLTLCVPLIWMLFSSAEALKCVQGIHMTNEATSKDPEPCNSPNVQCATVAHQDLTNTGFKLYSIVRTCASSSLCNESDSVFSLGYDNVRTTASLQCCSTDGCNNKPLTYPDEPIPNGLQCVTCSLSAPSCNQTQQCAGVQDRCIAANMTDSAGTYPVYGCASANLCEGDIDLKLKLLFSQFVHYDEVKFTANDCCNTSLCN